MNYNKANARATESCYFGADSIPRVWLLHGGAAVFYKKRFTPQGRKNVLGAIFGG
jgi:hypothetical protein